MSQLPVTAVVARRPAPGREAELEAWAHGIVETAAAFPGHRGAQILPPGADRDELVVAFSFDSAEELSAWEHSPERAAWVAKASGLTAGPATAHSLSGLESIFSAPLRASSPPPRWKTAVVIAIALYPMAFLVSWLVAPQIAEWPLWAKVLVNVALIVPWMAWLGVPWVSRLLKRWLHP